MNRTFITYSNIVCPLGAGTKEVFTKIISKTTGIKKDESGFFSSSFSPEDQKNIFGSAFSPASPAASKMIVRLFDQMVKEVDFDIKSEENLIVICSTKGDIESFPEFSEVPLLSLAKTIQSKYGVVTPPFIISNACISGLHGLIHGSRAVKNGLYKRAIVIGVDSASSFVKNGFTTLSAVSDKICSPFDKNRTGLNLGEGAAIAIIENSPANSNSIEILAGCLSNDANHITGPSRDGEGLYQALKQLLLNAGVDLPYNETLLSPHGTGTVYNDEMESIAFTRAELNSLSMVAFKGYLGHTLGVSGMLEAILCFEILHTGQLPVTLGYREHGVSGNIQFLKETEEVQKGKSLKYLIKTGSGFGGSNAAILFSKT